MSSRLRVNTIVPSTGTNVAIGTANGTVTFTDSVNFVLGTGSSIFSPASNTLTFGTNDAERLRITSGGSVAIGVNSPSDKLHVGGNNAFIRVDRPNGNPGLTLIYNSTNSTRADIDVTTGGDLRFATNDSTERLRITSAGLIGIGTVSPSGPIHAHVASGTQRSYLEASAAHSFLRLKSGSTSYNSGVEFFSGASNIANINGLGAGGLQFEVNGSERLRITSAGLIRVPDNGKFTCGAGDDLQIYHNGSHSFVENSTGELLIRAKAGENSINCNPDGSIELFHDNSKKFETVSNGTQTTGRVFLNGTNGGFDYNNTAHTLEYLVNGSTHSELNTGAYVPQGTKNLGSNAKRWGTLYLSTGIDFGANSNAAGMTSEVLDDYEEGNFTPIVRGRTTAGTASYGRTAVGKYTKVGRMVSVIVDMVFSGANGNGNVEIAGLPFAAHSGPYVRFAGDVTLLTAGLSWSNQIACYINDTNSHFWITNTPTSGNYSFVNINSNTTEILLHCTYMVS